MKYNNGDMDDLFRRASDRYPLRTDGADWDRLASALDGPMPPSDQEDGRRRRRVGFWWFLLVPLAGAGYLTWQAAGHQGKTKTNVAQVTSVSGSVTEKTAGSGRQPANPGTDLNGTRGKPAEPAGNKTVAVNRPVEGNPASAKNGTVMRTANPSPEKGIGNAVDVVVRSGNEKNANAGKVNRTSGVTAAENVTRSIHAADRRGRKAAGSMGSNTLQHAADGLPGVKRHAAGGTGAMPTAGEQPIDQDHRLLWAALDLGRAPVGDGLQAEVNVPAPVAPPISPTPQEKKSAGRSHGYIGIAGAPDFSTVRFQSMKGLGTTFGLLIGYGFNDRWAVETGIYVDRKRYYTEGEYFNTSKVRLPAYYYKLLNVDGACYMWEIPLNVRYNLSTGPRMKWFATAGLSTYLMTKENYTYQYENWANGPAEDSGWNIKRPSQYWFAILNLSAGFEQKLGKIGNLRLEPYIRIPMSGIGTGNLPIMSAGLNIGLTRRLW